MDAKYHLLKAFTLKSLAVIACLSFGFLPFSKCSAQAIVGKWKGVSVKNYYSAEYAKETGKSMEERTAKETGNSGIEFKTDHTFIVTYSELNDPKVNTMNGVWSLTGNELRLTLEPKFNPRKTSTSGIVSVVGNTMVTTVIFAAPSRITKMISTSTRN